LEIKTQSDSIYGEIYSKAKPYLDTRQNDVHIKCVKFHKR